MILSLMLLLSLKFTFAYEFRQAPIKDCTKLQAKCFDPNTAPNDKYYLADPFVMHAPGSKKVVVLVQGLTDSPYTWRDISIFLNKQGYNVYAVLLSGHGDTPNALIHASVQDWMSDVSKMINLAMKENSVDKVDLMGFSMGGALSTVMAEMPQYKDQIASLVLLEPAFKIQSLLGRTLCDMGLAEILKTWARYKEGGHTYGYNKMPMHSLCNLVHMGEVVRALAHTLTIPVFAVVNEHDENIIDSAIIKSMLEMKSTKKEVFYIHTSNISFNSSIPLVHYKTKPLRHSDIPYKNDLLRDYANPVFDQMMTEIQNFL